MKLQMAVVGFMAYPLAVYLRACRDFTITKIMMVIAVPSRSSRAIPPTRPPMSAALAVVSGISRSDPNEEWIIHTVYSLPWLVLLIIIAWAYRKFNKPGIKNPCMYGLCYY